MRRRFRTLCLTLALTGLVSALTGTVGASPAAAACYNQYVFTGVSGGIYDLPGGQSNGTWYTNYKINVHSYWSDAWIGGNVYTAGGTPIATGYVLRQYTAFSRTIC